MHLSILRTVFEAASPIPGIAAIHSIKVDSLEKIVGHALTADTDLPQCDCESHNGSEAGGSSLTNKEHCQIEVGDGYAVEYDGKVYPGEVKCVTTDDLQVSVMVRAGKYWKWPKPSDEIFYQHDKFVRK